MRRCFQGTNIVGMGFTFDDVNHAKGISSSLKEMSELTKHPNNSEAILPFLGGEEVANDPIHANRRFVIQFGDLSYEAASKRWPELMEIVRRLVKPTRDNDNRDHRRNKWWLHGEPQTGLYRAIANFDYVLAIAIVSPMMSFARVRRECVFAHSLVIFAYPNLAPFTVLQSRVHEIWARFFSSTLEDGLRYALRLF